MGDAGTPGKRDLQLWDSAGKTTLAFIKGS